MADAPVLKRRFTPNDWSTIAEFIFDEKSRRAKNREDLEEQWDQVEFQVSMKELPKRDGDPNWWPRLQLPLQAETLELLVADTRRLLFPPGKHWVAAHSSLTDKDLANLKFDSFLGIEPLNKMIDDRGPQAFADAIVVGILENFHGRYEFRDFWDLLHAQAFQYGAFVGRVINVERDKFSNEFRGVTRKSERFPVLAPANIREVYLDDAPSKVLHEGMMIAPGVIRAYEMDLSDALLAAKKGSTDPTSERGGWMPQALKELQPKKEPKNHVDVIEMEGDFVVPRSRGKSMFLPNVMVTAIKGEGSPTVVRYREREFPFRSYIHGSYHREEVGSPYGTSPLIKGAPLHKAATDALNTLLGAAMLNAGPPIAYSPDDHYLAAEGGPKLEPFAQWEAISEPKAIVTGKVGELLQVYLAYLQQYADLTGITAPRLGQQTKSHQTAFAIDTEQTRSQMRTVDYARSVMNGPLRSFLHMEYEMAKKRGSTRIFLKDYNGWVDIEGSQLPEIVEFDVHGAGAPAEEREKEQKALQALQTVLSLEPLVLQLKASGAAVTPLNLDNVRADILRRGGIFEQEAIFAPALGGVPGTTPGGPDVPGVATVNPGDNTVPLGAS